MKPRGQLMIEHRLIEKTLKLAEREIARVGKDRIDPVVIEKLRFLADFYPRHIAKEDKVFFPDTEKYFTAPELNDLLVRFHEFDRRMIHEKYERLYEALAQRY